MSLDVKDTTGGFVMTRNGTWRGVLLSDVTVGQVVQDATLE